MLVYCWDETKNVMKLKGEIWDVGKAVLHNKLHKPSNTCDKDDIGYVLDEWGDNDVLLAEALVEIEDLKAQMLTPTIVEFKHCFTSFKFDYHNANLCTDNYAMKYYHVDGNGKRDSMLCNLKLSYSVWIVLRTLLLWGAHLKDEDEGNKQE